MVDLLKPDDCIICEQPKETGIHIFSSFICVDCEQEMVKTEVIDRRYYYFIQRMKRIIYEKDA